MLQADKHSQLRLFDTFIAGGFEQAPKRVEIGATCDSTDPRKARSAANRRFPEEQANKIELFRRFWTQVVPTRRGVAQPQ